MKKSNSEVRPIMKWAGGKTQMLGELVPLVPEYPGKYIEPFFGGGALFFRIDPKNAVIADSNPELINLYIQIANNVEGVIEVLKTYTNTEELFYEVRAQDWNSLSKEEAAARSIFLNKTCFNGLYRVNRKGQFNTPFGKYKNPTICDEELLRNVAVRLKKATIICGDYLEVLSENAKCGDFIFLDPPYVPVSKYGDFKRYTKEQFYEDDHIRLANEVKRLQELGCYVLLTNSDHQIVFELYKDFEIKTVDTKRAISSKASTRKGKDVIVKAFPEIDNDRQ